uniref:Cytochrome P450 82D125 n=1 Tax=Reynoutria sachalinensis TaxID=76036 RepID=A0A140JTI3_9CARY|nr:cytochrome P450 82D125 [Fallopia sachalinensis]
MAIFFQLSPSLSSTCCILVSLLIPLLLIIKLLVNKNEDRSIPLQPPEAGGAWPIIGHLHLLGRALLPHKLLGEMADKYGPTFRMRIGVQKALVVSSWEMAKECYVLNDKAITSRPRLAVSEIMAYGDANIFSSPYGSYWRSLRKILSLELLSNHRLDMLSYVWKEEMNVCIKKLYVFWSNSQISGSDVVLVDLKQWFSQLSMSMIIRIIVGEKCVGCQDKIVQLRNILEDFFHRLGSFFIGDALPFLRWLDLGGQEKSMKKSAKAMDDIFEIWLREHKERRLSGSIEGSKDFMDVMLRVLDDNSRVINDAGFDDDNITKATCMGMLSGASDTTLVVLTWAISLLLNNRDVLKKAQEELNGIVGKNKQVNESDITKLVYLQAILKETLRLYPPAPLSAPREFNEDCTVGGYHVKKGTRLIVNLSKIHRDPRVWEDPMEFRPERFLTTHKDVDVRGRSFELIPFGSGRRMCPGMSFAICNTQLLLALFLQAFELSTPDGSLVDMTESFGLTNLKATPLHVLLTPRLSVDMYE